MPRAKFIDYRFSIPISSFARSGTAFVSSQIGKISVAGRARIDGDKLEDLPAAFALGTDWVEIQLESVHYENASLTPPETTNLLPMLSALPSCKPMLEMITGQARAHVKTIYDNENF